MTNTLIVGLDGSQLAERVLPTVETFAKALDAAVVLVRATRPEGASEPLPNENPHLLPFMVVMPTASVQAATEYVRNEQYEAEHYLDDIAKRLGEHGIRATGTAVEGNPAKVLVEEAEAHDARMLLLTTHGRSGLGRWIYGSVAEAVLAHSRVPVLLVRAWKSDRGIAAKAGPARILVPLDGTDQAERALPIAVEMAKALSADIHLVQIVPAIGEWTLGDEVWMGDTAKDLQKEDEKRATDYIATTSARLRGEGLSVTSTVRVDNVGDGIVTAAANEPALVVMATQAPTGLERTLLRSTALEVLHRLNLPILFVGPKVSAEAASA